MAKKIKLNKKEIEYFKKKLLSKRNESLTVIKELQNEALRESSKSEKTGDLSDMPIHMADVGSDTFEQELDLGQLEKERETIREIDHALEKIENNNYGFCETDGQMISKKRLDAEPWARNCLKCQAELEKSS